MLEDADNEKLLIRYLLGNLTEEQRLQVEELFLIDDQSYERLLALENELFYDYAQKNLSPVECEQFEKRFLSSAQNRKKAMIASALARMMSEPAPAETAEKSVADPQGFWRSLKSYFVAQNMAMKGSLAALAIMAIALIWLAIGIVRLRSKVNYSQTQIVVREDQLRRQTQQERARADDLNLRLKREMDENEVLQQELNKMQAQFSGRGTKEQAVVSLALAPSVVRDQAQGMKRLYLPPSASLLKLKLHLKGEVEYKSYQVILMTAEGAEKWSRDMLQVQQTGSGRSIVFSLPARFLEEGDYELRLKGYALDGALEETGDYYYLSVRRK